MRDKLGFCYRAGAFVLVGLPHMEAPIVCWVAQPESPNRLRGLAVVF